MVKAIRVKTECDRKSNKSLLKKNYQINNLCNRLFKN
jgi:hypothetical protein